MNPSDHDLLLTVVEAVSWLKLGMGGLYALVGGSIVFPLAFKKKTGRKRNV
jgi:hypothetical protein